MERLKPGDRVSIKLMTIIKTGTVISDDRSDNINSNRCNRLVYVKIDGGVNESTPFSRFRFRLLTKLEEAMK